MESFIVRIYRQGRPRKGTAQELEGIVERVSTQKRMAFHNLGELMDILQRITSVTKRRGIER